MPFVDIVDPRASDVILEEEENRFSRDVVTVNFANTGAYKQGTIVFRVKGTDPTAAWDVVDAAGDLSLSNEYAVLLGAQVKGQPFTLRESSQITAATNTSAIVLRRMARIKESVPLAIHGTAGYGLTSGNMATLKHLLAFQNILVEDSYVAVA